jgi:hypothetical protein
LNKLIAGFDSDLEFKGHGKTNRETIKRIEYELAKTVDDTNDGSIINDDEI